MENLTFGSHFRISMTCMKINRCHPFLKRDIKWFLQFLVLYSIFFTAMSVVVYDLIYSAIAKNDISQVCTDMTILVMFVYTTFQYILLLLHQNHFQKLIEIVINDFELSKTLPRNERRIVIDYANQGRFVCQQWLVLIILGNLAFIGRSAIYFIYYWAIGDFQMVPFYEAMFPDFIESRKDNVFVFLLTYFLWMYYAMYGSIMYVSIVPMGPIFLLHACGQLELMRIRAENIFAIRDARKIEEELKKLLKHQQLIYQFVEPIRICFKLNYEFTLKGASIVIPFTVYEFIGSVVRGSLSTDFLIFILGAVMIAFAPCYYSNKLMDKGLEVSYALYSSGWEQYYNKRTHKILLLMLINANRPIAIRTVFRTLSLQALTDVFRQAYTIYNLLNVIWR